jgi:hypothetical protein
MGIDLSSTEVDAYLLASPRGILCVTRPGKAPLALPMWFGWIDGNIVMTTLSASKKVAPIRENPLVSFLVESGEGYFTLKALLLVGNCELQDDPHQVRQWQERIRDNKPMYKEYFPEQLPPYLEKFYSLPRTALLITPSSVTSWDFAKVRA